MPLFTTFKYTATIGNTTQTYYFRAKQDEYPTAVAALCGIAPAAADEQNRALTKVEELVGKGVLIRLVASTGVPGSTARKNVKLLCSKDRLSNALDNLEGQLIRGEAITSVRVPQKATFF